MSQELSPQKVTRLLSLLLAGHSQTAIARKLNISQSTVSLYATRFGAAIAQSGPEAAGRKFNIMDQVQALHNLGSELRKAGLTVEEASLGVKAYRKLQALSVSDDDYPHLVAAGTSMKNDGYLQAAIRLSQLEKSAGLPYGQVITTLENARRELRETKAQLKRATYRLRTTQAGLSTMEGEEKVASRELADRMAKVGADMKRIEQVEKLALALKSAGISDGELDTMIQRQQRLNQAGLSLNNLTGILERVAVITSRDQGKQLLGMLSQYGGLAGAIEEQKNRIDMLTRKAEGVEERAREKVAIENEIASLRNERANLQQGVAKLKDEVQPLTGLKNEVGMLRGRKLALQAGVAELERQRQVLDGEIVARQQKVVNLSEAEAKYKQLSKHVEAMQSKLENNQQRLKMLDAFVGAIGATSMNNLDAFAQVLPEMIAEAKLKHESPKELAGYVFSRLAGDVLRIYRCFFCGAKFATDKPKEPYSHYTCPACGLGSGWDVVEDETVILRGAMKVAQPLPAPPGGIRVAPGLIAIPRKRPDANPVP